VLSFIEKLVQNDLNYSLNCPVSIHSFFKTDQKSSACPFQHIEEVNQAGIPPHPPIEAKGHENNKFESKEIGNGVFEIHPLPGWDLSFKPQEIGQKISGHDEAGICKQYQIEIPATDDISHLWFILLLLFIWFIWLKMKG